MRKYQKNFRIIARGIRLIEELASGFVLLCILQAMLKALLPLINIYLLATIINGITSGQGIDKLLFNMTAMLVSNLVCGGATALVEKYVNVKRNLFRKNFYWQLNKKLMNIAYADVDDFTTKEQRERINQMEQVNGMGIWNLITGIQTVIESTFSVIFSVVIFISFFLRNIEVKSGDSLTDFFCSPHASVLLAALILSNIFVNLYTVSSSTKKIFNGFAELVPLNQVYGYYLDNYIDTYHSGKDIRLYSQGRLIQKEMDQLLKSGQVPLEKLKKIEFKYNGLSSVSTILMNTFLYLMVSFKAVSGVISVGDIVQYIGGIERFILGFNALVSQFTVLNANTEALELILQYLDKESGIKQGTRMIDCTIPMEICFQNVSFTYPNTDVPVLRNLSFTIRTGDKLAIVGMNGSGKTTVIKLLCRFYDPDEGAILINGVNIKEFKIEEYQNLFSVVFQDFQLFSFELGQVVSGKRVYDVKKVENVLKKVGIESDSISIGNVLYKEFEEQGTEISGGEAQKIAIARAFYKEAPIFIFDEPTAALDPQSEYEIYKNLDGMVEEKTVIFVSHRMSSCRFCNKVMVFDGGRLVQEGTHDALLKNKQGKYCELWYAQEQYYD